MRFSVIDDRVHARGRVVITERKLLEEMHSCFRDREATTIGPRQAGATPPRVTRRIAASSSGWQLDVFGAKADADQARRNTAQQRPLPEQPQRQRRRQFSTAPENMTDHPVLDK